MKEIKINYSINPGKEDTLYFTMGEMKEFMQAIIEESFRIAHEFGTDQAVCDQTIHLFFQRMQDDKNFQNPN